MQVLERFHRKVPDQVQEQVLAKFQKSLGSLHEVMATEEFVSNSML